LRNGVAAAILEVFPQDRRRGGDAGPDATVEGQAMESKPGPVLLRRQVGGLLRRLRETAGRSLNEVAEYLDCSPAKVSRIETGRMVARLPDVRSMLDLYGTPDTERKHLLGLVRDSRERGWWREYADILAEGMETFHGLQDAARTIDWFDPAVIPDLLQTREYAYALHRPRHGPLERHADRLVQLRMASQRVLDRADPPRLHAIVDETALRRGADSAAVMRDQVRHLRAVAARPGVTVQVVPFSAGFVPVRVGFVAFGLPDPARPRVVFVEQALSGRSEAKPESHGRYALAFDRLRSAALSPADSDGFLARVAEELTDQRAAG
jgi:transcriptional regulator with XRE-family HTH domain